MKIEKIVIIIGAVITLLSTFFFSFGQTLVIDGRTHISGLGFLFNLPQIFGDPSYWISTFPSYTSEDIMTIYILGVVFTIFIFSGVIQLVGLKNKYIGISGAILTIAFAITITYLISPPAIEAKRFGALLWNSQIIDGVWPLNIPVINADWYGYFNISLGTITLYIGGGFGIAGGILGILNHLRSK
ncbi:MAG: hypothetical protein ACFE9S_07920 [Candidatus Hermodarchaeota archaeon]